MAWICKNCGGDMRRKGYGKDFKEPVWCCLNCRHETPRRVRTSKADTGSLETFMQSLLAKKED